LAFFLFVDPDLMTWLAYMPCSLRLARVDFFFQFLFFFHLIGWNLSFIVFLVSVIVFIFIGFHDYFLFNVVNLLSFVYFFLFD